MKELLKQLVLKYTGFKVEDSQDLFELPVYCEVWLYVIIELEEKYSLPMIKVIDEIGYDEFNIEVLSKKLQQLSSS